MQHKNTRLGIYTADIYVQGHIYEKGFEAAKRRHFVQYLAVRIM